MNVSWSDQARVRLDEIWQYIAADNPAAAERWVARLIARAEAAAVMPLAGRVVPELNRPTIREVFERTYRIVYRVDQDQIYVLTVFEGHRLLRPEELEEES